MINPDLSNKLWHLLKTRSAADRSFNFTVNIRGADVRVETFSVWKRVEGGHREKKRDYYRMVRDTTETVLYDQLEDVSRKFVDQMGGGVFIAPDISISPNRANKLLCAALEQQHEVDRLIAEART